MGKKQSELPGFERKTIGEVSSAAETYEEHRDKRIAMTEKEVSSKVMLIEVMKKHSLKIYRDDSASPPIVVKVTSGKANVKVERLSKKKVAEEEGAIPAKVLKGPKILAATNGADA